MENPLLTWPWADPFGFRAALATVVAISFFPSFVFRAGPCGLRGLIQYVSAGVSIER
jgi:hypothetical protein